MDLNHESLLYYIMYMISLPVDAHIKDGSVYSGIFYTVNPQNNDVVLKNAKLAKKGRRGNGGNVGCGVVVETLVIEAKDLVQVVAKDVRSLVMGDDGIDEFQGVEGSVKPAMFMLPCGKAVPKVSAAKKKSKKTRVSKKNGISSVLDRTVENARDDSLIDVLEKHDVRTDAAKSFENRRNTGNIKVNGIHLAKIVEASVLQATTERQVESDKPQEEKARSYRKNGINEEKIICEPQFPKISLNMVSCASPIPSLTKPDMKGYDWLTSRDLTSSDVCSLDNETPTSPVNEATLTAFPSSSASAADLSAPDASATTKNEKAFKFNPGAKTFSPISAACQSSIPVVPVAATSTAYIQNSLPGVPVGEVQPEVRIGSFPQYPPSPVKFFQHNNNLVANGGNGSHYSQYTVGHFGSRQQPVRHSTQFNSVQVGPSYTHPNLQPITVGGIGPSLFYVSNPQDVMYGTTTPQVLCARSTPNTHSYLVKHQGHTGSQTLLVCPPPPTPFVQHPFTIANHVPYPQPSFLAAVRPYTVIGSNIHLGPKFI